MKAITNFFISAIALFLLFGCTSKKQTALSADELVQAVNEKKEGVFSKTIGNIIYKLQYKPLDYVMLLATKDQSMSEAEKKELEAEYARYEYYTLELGIKDFTGEILKYNLQSNEDYEERVKYYAFKFQDDLSMVVGKDTLPCLNYHFERNYGIAPNARFLLAFNKQPDTEQRTFICNEKYLGNSTVKLAITPDDLAGIPTLKQN